MTSQGTPGRESVIGRKSASFHGRLPMSSDRLPQMKRPESHPELLRRVRGPVAVSISGSPSSPDFGGQKLTKLLLNVTIQRSLGPVQVVMSLENTVEDLIKAALEIYVKEKRRPLLTETDPQSFELHYSQFSLESLNPKEKLISLGSRNFFLCSKPTNNVNSSCSDQAEKAAESPSTWTKLFGFLAINQ